LNSSNALFDFALVGIKERFEQFRQYAEAWGFLYWFSEFPKIRELIKHSSHLHLSLTVGSGADVEGSPLCDQLIGFECFVKKIRNRTPLKILNFMKKPNMEDLYPNMCVSLRILLTMPVSLACGERGFPNLKLWRPV
jgi:hypothetical protein